MKNPNVQYYGTPRQIQEYAIRKYNTTGSHISFVRALDDLLQTGNLYAERPKHPAFVENMNVDQFDDMLLSLPFNASNIIKHDRRLHGEGTLEEESLFPWEKDVFCFKHMPYMDPRPHIHDYFELTYIAKGSCRLLFENETIVLEEGSLCIIPPGSPHSQPLTPDCIAVGMSVRKSTFDSIFGELLTIGDLVASFFRTSLYQHGQANYLILQTEILPRLTEIVQQLVYESNSDSPFANVCSISLLKLFLALTFRRYHDRISIYRMDSITRSHHDFPIILQYIQQNYRTVTLSSLARSFQLSESYLCKLIQKHTGKSFTAILRRIKLSRAVHYLSETDLKIWEIADLVGYSSVDHFSRTFKKHYSMPPADYRTQRRAVSV